jgi:hypothetical protein
VITLPNNLDGALTGIETPKYILTNASDSIKVNVSNLGAININTLVLNYTIGNSSINTQTFTLANGLSYKQTNLTKFSLPYTVSSAGNFKAKVWISSVNTIQDQNQSNDTTFTYITVQSYSPKKSVLIEQFVSAYDGDCTDAQQKVLALQNDSVIIVNVHDLDSLKETNSIGILNTYKKNTATAMIDRTYFSGPESVSVTRPYYNNLVAKQLKTVTPASVSIINKTYNSVTKQLSFTVKADFIGDVKGDLRLNAYLTENNVSGPSSDISANGYNQLNNYYNVSWSPYYQLGIFSSTYSAYVLKPYQFKHHNTLVYSFDGSFGNPGLIPTNGGTQGQSYQKTYTLTVPTPTNSASLYNSDNLYIVAFLAEYNSNQNNRNVLNVVKEKITPNSEILGVQEEQGNSFISLFPNPSNGNMYINSPKSLNTYEIKAIDIMGRCVFIETLNQVGNQAQLDLSALNNGVYFLSISSENGSFIEKVIIQKN